ncbi:MAG: nitroreductase family deazaflavin-dependent oxidoreductase [Actinomycetales bacterium]|nr:nitroreductase family deazaflavin-dependent oxidoreductase [Actinomycetales bacterium]
MSFNTTNGTRGGRQPQGAFLKWTNTLMSRRIARKGKAPGMRFDALVLVTLGAKTGEERRIPLACFPGEDGSWLVVAAAAGAPRNPAWYYNLAAHPDRVSIEVPGGSVAVTAEQLHGAEREKAWSQIVAASAQFAKYQEKTDRQLPVIRLSRISGGSSATPTRRDGCARRTALRRPTRS